MSSVIITTKDTALNSLFGTYTFVSESKADLGFYNVMAFLVVHLMPDPLRFLGCTKKNCSEVDNQVCQKQNECANVETQVVEWSDVSAFYSFGYQINTGFPWRTHIIQNTSTFLGPYNVVMAQKDASEKNKDNPQSLIFLSRVVHTAATEYVNHPPVGCSIVSAEHFDLYAGVAAVQNSIHQQVQTTSKDLTATKKTTTNADPYAKYLGNCDNGSLQPVLPKFSIGQKKGEPIEFSLSYPLLSIPESNKDPLYKVWPSLKKRLKDSAINGPYCFDNELKAYTMDVSFRSGNNDTQTSWKFTKGCLAGLPCWSSSDGATNSTIPGSNSSSSSIPDDFNKALLTYGCYFLLLAFLLSMLCNCLLSQKLKRTRRHQDEEQPLSSDRNDLEEPLLQNTLQEEAEVQLIGDDNEEGNEVDPTN